MSPARVVATAAVALACGGCGSNASLVLELLSSLAIPGDTNRIELVVARDGEQQAVVNEPLGTPPRDVWPQTITITSESGQTSGITVAIRLWQDQDGKAPREVGRVDPTPVFQEKDAERQVVWIPPLCGPVGAQEVCDLDEGCDLQGHCAPRCSEGSLACSQFAACLLGYCQCLSYCNADGSCVDPTQVCVDGCCGNI